MTTYSKSCSKCDKTIPKIEGQMEADIFKNKLVKEKGYKLVRVWEDEIDKVWRLQNGYI